MILFDGWRAVVKRNEESRKLWLLYVRGTRPPRCYGNRISCEIVGSAGTSRGRPAVRFKFCKHRKHKGAAHSLDGHDIVFVFLFKLRRASLYKSI